MTTGTGEIDDMIRYNLTTISRRFHIDVNTYTPAGNPFTLPSRSFMTMEEVVKYLKELEDDPTREYTVNLKRITNLDIKDIIDHDRFRRKHG